MVIRHIRRGRAYMVGEGLGPTLIRNLTGTGAVRIASMAASFLVGAQLARMLGVEGYGYYGLALSIVTIAGIPGEMGLPRLVTREIAAAQAHGDLPRLFGVLHWARWVALRLSLLMAVLALGAAFVVAANRPSVLALAILFGAPVIPLMALSRIQGGAMQGLHQVVRGQIPDNLFRPLLMSLVLFAMSFAGLTLGASGAMALSSVTAGASFLLATFLLKDLLPRPRPATFVREGRKWLASSIPLALTNGMRTLQTELSILLLGTVAAPAAVGLFRVANVTATVAAVVIAIVGQAVMPTMARLYAQGRMDQLQRLVAFSAGVQFAGVLVLSFPLMVAAGPLLGFVFGKGFVAGGGPLMILALGQIINSAFGPNALLLNMTKHEQRVTRAMAIALVVNIIAVPLLTLAWGTNGAAVAMVCSVLCWNLIGWHDAKVLIGIETSFLLGGWKLLRPGRRRPA